MITKYFYRFILFLSVVVPVEAFADGEELDKVLNRIMTSPTIHTADNFVANVLVPPGELYDPLWMIENNGSIWINDDGGEEGEHGSQIVSIDSLGQISRVIGIGRLKPATGFDIAPKEFGEFAGQIFTISQAEVGAAGSVKNHIVQRVDPGSDAEASTFCTLPNAGDANGGIPGYGTAASFGPIGTAFENRFFVATVLNNTIYSVTADGVCKPFITFDAKPWGAPFGVTFSADGKSMLVTVSARDKSGQVKKGAVARVLPNGEIAEILTFDGLVQPAGLAIAPQSFADYGGQLFIADGGIFEVPVPASQPVSADGKIYRVDAKGQLKLVASGFFNPASLRFVGDKIWVSDVNGDFIAGGRELPDGVVITLGLQ